MSGTERELSRRLMRLLALGALFCAALAASYRGVHSDAVPLAGSTAPAVLAVDTARDALERARSDAERGAAGSSDFQTQTSVVNQSLALTASENVTGPDGRQTLQTVAGLISVYVGWVQRANAEPDGSPLADAYRAYASDTLGSARAPRPGVITERLDALQDDQRDVVARQTGFGLLLELGWATVLLLGAALLVALLETQRFLRRRFKRRWNVPLLAATALLLLSAAALAGITWRTRHRLEAVRATLASDQSGDGIRAAGDRVAADLHSAGLHAALANWILVGALLLIALLVAGLLPRLREYPSRPTAVRLPLHRVLVVLGACLVLLAGGVAVHASTDRWHGTVTLLANWSRDDEEKFQRTVIRPFEAAHHIHVIYQGSSAESQVLAADTEMGTAPDVVVMPGPGELADYAERGHLTALDTLIDADDFVGPLAPRVTGPDHTTRHTYWVPIKADVKSLVWRPSALPASRLAATAADPAAWCLGMGSGATSGWPGTDWVEDILLQQAGPGFYQRWATGRKSWTDSPEITRAFTTWGELVGAGEAKTAPGALRTDYQDAPDALADASGPCRLAHAGAFVLADPDLPSARLRHVPSATVIPQAAGTRDSWEVSGDLAAVLHDTPQSRSLIRYLASTPVQRAWSHAERSFSASRRVGPDAYPDPTAHAIASGLHDEKAAHCWDASDAMPPAMRDAFTQAALEYLARPDRLAEQLSTLEKVRTGEVTQGRWFGTVC